MLHDEGMYQGKFLHFGGGVGLPTGEESPSPHHEETTTSDEDHVQNDHRLLPSSSAITPRAPTLIDHDQDNVLQEMRDLSLSINEQNNEDEKIHHPSGVSRSSIRKDEVQGPWIRLPNELTEKILFFLGDIDMCGYLFMTSKVVFQPQERVFQFLCELCYPCQLMTRQHPLRLTGRWKSWQEMLINRPRLRTNGFYTLRTIYSKLPCNDAFWEERQRECIEVRYYRHFRFFDHGRVLYSLDLTEPHDMIRWLQSGQPIAKRVYEGRYTLQRNQVRIEVPVNYYVVVFDLLLLDGDDGYVGKHNMLTLVSHSSMNKDGSGLPVKYPLPHRTDFRFHRVWNFSPRYDPPR
eukprot:gene1637-1788_t